jgi:hypothetical protein
LKSPETENQNRGYRRLTRPQRPDLRHLNARKSPQIAGYSSETRNRRFVSECVVADALALEPVSTPKFPFIRENNREFCESDGFIDCLQASNSPHFGGLAEIP